MLLASGMTKMYILSHFDWFGPQEKLKEFDKKLKAFYDGKDGVEFLGRFGPHNQKFHYTFFYKAKDFNAWINRKMPSPPIYERKYDELTHNVMEYYTDT